MSNIVLLTGATGFVGYQVLRELNRQRVQTRVVIREGSTYKLPEDIELESTVTTDDLFAESVEWWIDVLEGVDTVIHLAWYAEPEKYVASIKNMDCMIGTLNMAKAAIKAKVRRFVGVGSCSEYRLTGSKLSAQTLLDPCTPYAASKGATYMALVQLLPSQGVSFLWCRLFYLYGAREDSRRLVPYLRENLSAGESVELTSGQQYRDFLDVQEAGEMLVKNALTDKTGAINICSGVAVTVRELAEKIADEYGRRDLLNFGARECSVFDPPYVVGIKEQNKEE